MRTKILAVFTVLLAAALITGCKFRPGTDFKLSSTLVTSNFLSGDSPQLYGIYEIGKDFTFDAGKAKTILSFHNQEPMYIKLMGKGFLVQYDWVRSGSTLGSIVQNLDLKKKNRNMRKGSAKSSNLNWELQEGDQIEVYGTALQGLVYPETRISVGLKAVF